MKPTKEIIGLRVISISDGTQVGVVKDVVLSQQGKSLNFVIIDQPSDYFGAKVISFENILGIGEFAMTIPNPDVIQDVAQNNEVQQLLKQDIRVIGTKVLTKKGQLIGEVKEIVINEDTGHIASCRFESEGRVQEVNAERIITLGKELLIVEAEPVLGDYETLETEEPTLTIQDLAQDLVAMEETPEEQSYNSLEGSDKQEDLVVQEVISESIKTVGEEELGFNLFEQRQLQYFIGKKVDKDIILDNGDLLSAGEYISPEMVTHIKTRSTLMEVTSHLQKN
ncbi:hypothetical protein Desor_3423 [Desulfosporosinus orientis DSM 765]|uniref:PRC-barrel domain-containing protein n=1 Tax=Desulfosporosinus orientis (strain ATCC 19365 / DSM 765 / NCIMB 8382 / VKM B-1628 / Singapore I) TaxID=768706 RepID=G7WFP5_DESOD|nr:PRC-barrel domain-containing protein [Desulfosporosinus orientis]AET68918.1 hypothetical protein Desor_3423 [Desulfosporosinus orientis DSM 765]